MIDHKSCVELGLLPPKTHEKEVSYLLRIMKNGNIFNTRMARDINIGNLHSILPTLKKRGYKFTTEHKTVKCPRFNITPPHAVDVVYMTPEQIALNKKIELAKTKELELANL